MKKDKKKFEKAMEAIEKNGKNRAFVMSGVYVSFALTYYLALFLTYEYFDKILKMKNLPFPEDTYFWTIVISFAVAIYNDCFDFDSARYYKQLYGLYLTLIITVAVVLALPAALIDYQVSKLLMIGLVFIQLFLMPFWLSFARCMYYSVVPPLSTVLISDGDGIDIKSYVNRFSKKYRIVKTVNSEDCNLESIVKAASAIIIDTKDEVRKQQILECCADMDKPVLISPSHTDIMMMCSDAEYYGDFMAISIKSYGFSHGQRIVKRAFDLLLTLIIIVPVSVLILFLSIIIFLEDKHNPLYAQKRLTINGREYNVLKLRTMIPDAESAGPALAEKDDPRITKFGKFLRASRLDELPQIYNVLTGDMSIVGPRPEREHYYKMLDDELPEFRKRLKVKGGVTGLAQVYGRYSTSYREKLNMDLAYIQSYSIILDMKIILETFRVLMTKSSAEGLTKNERDN